MPLSASLRRNLCIQPTLRISSSSLVARHQLCPPAFLLRLVGQGLHLALRYAPRRVFPLRTRSHRRYLTFLCRRLAQAHQRERTPRRVNAVRQPKSALKPPKRQPLPSQSQVKCRHRLQPRPRPKRSRHPSLRPQRATERARTNPRKRAQKMWFWPPPRKKRTSPHL